MTETAETTPAPKMKGADLKRLTQAQAAYVLDFRTSHLREHAAKYPQEADGGYDAQALVRAAMRQLEPAELDDAELENVRQLCERLAIEVSRYSLVVRLLERIKAASGTLGMATVGCVLLEVFTDMQRVYGHSLEEPHRTPDEIRKYHKEQAEQQIERQAHREAVLQGRVVLVCEKCGRYRWGRKWLKGAPPIGYAVEHEEVKCQKCDPEESFY